MPWLILVLYMLGEPYVLLALSIISLLSILAFVFFDERIHDTWAQQQRMPEEIIKTAMRIWLSGFLSVVLFSAGLIMGAVRDNFYSVAENIAIIFSLGTAFAYVYLLFKAKKWIREKRDSKSWM